MSCPERPGDERPADYWRWRKRLELIKLLLWLAWLGVKDHISRTLL